MGGGSICICRFICSLFQHITQRGKQDLKLVLRGRLNREAQARYNFRVVAYDGGDPPLTGVMNVFINVEDINDNAPVFSNDTYYVTVAEDVAVGRSVITVRAVDSDEGANGQVRNMASSHLMFIPRKLGSAHELTLTLALVIF